MTRTAANSVTKGIKFFIAKKKYYIERQRIDPNLIEHSRFLSIINKKSSEQIQTIVKNKNNRDNFNLFDCQDLPGYM